MSTRALITGGAGFIGSHLADELLRCGYQVRVLDALVPQVHEGERGRPAYLARAAELVVGDVRDPRVVRRALEDVDVVFHLASAVGVGQSMWRVTEYLDTNTMGASVLLEALIARPVARLIVASSMSVYGEGLYRDDDDQLYEDVARSPERLACGDWEPRDARGRPLAPLPTPETKRPSLASVYALSKYDQERLGLMIGATYGIPTTALRFFNVYGPRQALSNPYTGVLAIFAARLLHHRPPLIFEDGRQRRDFVHVRDVARACRLALDAPASVGGVFNIGSGDAITILEVAHRLARVLERDVEPELIGQYRVGDIRHCTADLSQAAAVLGYRPEVAFDDGLAELGDWLGSQVAHDRIEGMCQELAARGLAR